jgi:hypothetical protein
VESLSDAGIRELFIEQVRRMLPGAVITATDDPTAIELDCGDRSANLLLYDAFTRYRAGQTIEEIAEGYLPMIRDWTIEGPERFESWDEVAPRLALQILSDDVPIRPDITLVSMPTKYPDLVATAAIDCSNYVQRVAMPMFELWGVSEDEVLRRAMAQTACKVPKWERQTLPNGRSVFVASDSEGFAASAILCDELLDALPISRKHLFVAAPCRDIAIAFESKNPERDADLSVLSHKVDTLYREQAHTISPLVFHVKKNGGVRILAAVSEYLPNTRVKPLSLN